MKVALIEAPLCKGSPSDGSQYAYRSLLAAGLPRIFEEVRCVPMTPPPSMGEFHSRMKFLPEVMEVSRSLFSSVSRALSDGYFPIVLGGDHSVAMGSIAAASSYCGTDNLAVVYVDGHTDINTDQTTLTGYIHGMPLAAAMGLCDDALTVDQKIALRGQNTYIIGARSIDPEEYQLMAEQGVTLYTAEEVKTKGVDAVMAEVLVKTAGKRLHVSFDVDVLDCDVFASTGYQMPQGLTMEDIKTILFSCFATGRVLSFDCVEYNPLLDAARKDEAALMALFGYLFAADQRQ